MGRLFRGTLSFHTLLLFVVAYFFANPRDLDAEKVHNGLWPHDTQERPLTFHPSVIVQRFPPDSAFSKHVAATVVIELCRSIHCLWKECGEELDNVIDLLKQYLQKIYTNYGEDEMVWVISMAALTAPSCDRMLDLAADGLGNWKA